MNKNQRISNEELKVIQQEAMEQYKRDLEEEPAVKKWVDHKKTLRSFAIIFLLVYYLVEYLAYRSVDAEIDIKRLVIKTIFAIFWISIFMMPTLDWKSGCTFYIFAVWNFISLLKLNQNDLSLYFKNGPMISIFFIMSVAIPILFLLLACWLTIPKKNRILADRAQELNKKYMENIKQIYK